MSTRPVETRDDRPDAERAAEQFRTVFQRLRDAVARQFVGQTNLVEHVLASLLVGGHTLIEGVPGLGKTLLVRTLAAAVDVQFSRIQFTPDLMPTDITGTMVLHETPGGAHELRFEPGPVVANFVLADEINRATPKTQAALLEAMQERQLSAGRQTIRMPEPFMVLATQNPIEQEGTYPLPEAQLDRFVTKLLVSYPDEEEYLKIMALTTGTLPAPGAPVTSGDEVNRLRAIVRQVVCADQVMRYAVRIVRATQPGAPGAPEAVRRAVALGASPRGVQALILLGKVRALREGRYAVACEDIRHGALPALRHRLLLNFEAQAEGVSPDDLIGTVLDTVSELTEG